MSERSKFKWVKYLQDNRPDISVKSFRYWCFGNRPKKIIFNTEQELLQTIQIYDNKQIAKHYTLYIQKHRPDIEIESFRGFCKRNRQKKLIFDTEQELLQAISLYDNRKTYCSEFNWCEYLQQNRQDINIKTFAGWCHRYRPKKRVFNTEQELLEAISLYDNRRKPSQFNWQQYLKENRPEIDTITFRNWCIRCRTKKSIFDTEQEFIKTLKEYDKSEKVILSQFKWRQYLKDNRPDIDIRAFKLWCLNNRQKKSIFDTEQELLETLKEYDKRRIASRFDYQQYLKDNRPDISIEGFKSWCTKNRQNGKVFNTENELLQAVSLYILNKKEYEKSEFNWRQYLADNSSELNMRGFIHWCCRHRERKTLFDTEKEFLDTMSLYELSHKYIIKRTQYDDIYNLIEKETGLKFNFYKLEDMIGLI